METNEKKYFVQSVEDVKIYGHVQASILSRIRWWCQYNEENKIKDRFHDGEWWSGFMSINDFSEQTGTPYSTVKKNLRQMIKDNIIYKGCYNKKGFDKTNWYRINRSKMDSPWVQNGPINETKMDPRKVQNELMDDTKMDPPIPVNLPLNLPLKLSVNPVSINLENTSKEISTEEMILKKFGHIPRIIDRIKRNEITSIQNLNKGIPLTNEDKELIAQFMEEQMELNNNQ
jgi:hypothetical protein